MVDAEMYFEELGETARPILGDLDDTLAHSVSGCLYHVCLKSKQRGTRQKTSRYSTYDELYPETT